MPYDFTLTAILPASAQDVYDAWLDGHAHSAMTGGEASMSDEIDAEVSAWDGYITGRTLYLLPGQRIVQSWRTTKFAEYHEDSVITVSLEDADGGTLLTLVHSNVPDGQTSYEQGGWEAHYFKPMKAYFAKPRQASPARKTKAAASKGKPKGTAAKAKSKPSPAKATASAGKGKAQPKAAAKAKPRGAAAKARSKPSPAKATASAGKRKPQPKAAPKAKPKAAGRAKGKPARGGRSR
jgi:uncharacterized protein YndB with AHSA1/START domain